MGINLFISIFITVCYFIISWGVDWEAMYPTSTVSISYLFDIFFVLGISYIYKIVPNLNFRRLKFFQPRLFSTIVLSISSVYLVALFFNSPFRYVEQSVLQLLILAPIIEEFVFRHAFMGIFAKTGLPLQVRVWLNAFLFAFSHIPGLWNVPAEFQGFIVFQIFYTLLLGRICAMGKFKHRSVLGPIVLHFWFNLIFVISIKLNFI